MAGFLAGLAAVPGAMGALGSVGAGIVSGLFGMGSQRSQNAAQMSMDSTTREWNTSERLASQGFSSGERYGSQRYATEAWARENKWDQINRARDRSDVDRRRTEDFTRAKNLENSRLQRLAADAKAAGIHPLAALGGAGAGYTGGGSLGGGSSPPPQASVPSGPGAAYSAMSPSQVSPAGNPMGDSLLSGVNMALNFRREALENARVKSEINVNQAREQSIIADARSRTIAANSRRQALAPTPASTSTTIELAGKRPKMRPTDKDRSVRWQTPGHDEDKDPNLKVPFWITGVDEFGNEYRALNPDLVEAEIAQTINAATLMTDYTRNNREEIRKREAAAMRKARREARENAIVSPGFQTYTRDDYPNFWGF